MYRYLRLIALVLIAAVVAAGCGAPQAPASTPTASEGDAEPTAAVTLTPTAPGAGATATSGRDTTRITLALGYIPTVQFAPYYVAAEKGYYREEGLDLEFRHGIVTDLLNLVGVGEQTYAVASGDEMLLARAQGVPVVYVGAYFQKYPVTLITPRKANVTELEQIKGKTIGVPGTYGATYTGLKALLFSAGLTEQDVTVRSIGFTQVQALQRGEVDAVMGYANNEPIQLEELGVPVDTIPVWEHANLVSNGLVTNDRNLQENPEEVGALVRATMRGLQYTIDHPEEAFEISLKYVPEAAESRDVQMKVLRASVPLWQSEVAEQHGLGYTDPAAWEATRDFLRKSGALTTDVDLEKAYTNRFVEAP